MLERLSEAGWDVVEGKPLVAAGMARRTGGSAPWTGPFGALAAPALRVQPGGVRVPTSMILGLTASSLVIWSVDRLVGRRPRRLVGRFVLGSAASLQAVGPSGSGGIGHDHVVLVLDGRPIHLEAPSTFATTIEERVPPFTG